MNDRLQKCKAVAAELGVDYPALENRIKNIMSAPLRCGVVGGSGSGKSYVIRHLLGYPAPLLENSFSRAIECAVSYSSRDYVVCENKRLAISDLANLDSDCGTVQIFLNNDLLKNKSLTIVEIAEADKKLAADDASGMLRHLGILDACIVVIDAQMPLGKEDVQNISYLRSMNIPTFVVVTKLERLQPEDREKVTEYLRARVSDSAALTLRCPTDTTGLETILAEIRSEIENDVSVCEPLRANQCQTLISEFVKTATEAGEAKLNTAKEKLQKVAVLAQNKRLKLLSCLEEWDAIHTELENTADKIEQDIQKAVASREIDMLEEANTMLRRMQDCRTFWEEELSPYLDKVFRHEIDRVNTMLQRGLGTAFSKLQRQHKNRIDKAIIELPDFECADSRHSETRLRHIENLSNLHTLQTTSRIVTGLAMLGAGTFLATVGTGGLLMGVSVLTGIASDYLIRKTVEKDKKKISELLPGVIRDISMRISLHVSDMVKKEFRKLEILLIELRDEWKQKAQQTIETQTATAEKSCQDEIDRVEALLVNIRSI